MFVYYTTEKNWKSLYKCCNLQAHARYLNQTNPTSFSDPTNFTLAEVSCAKLSRLPVNF